MVTINNPFLLRLSSPLAGAAKIGPTACSLITTSPGIISSVNRVSALSHIPSALPIAPGDLVIFARETGLTGQHITPALRASSHSARALGSLPHSVPAHTALALQTPRFINDLMNAVKGITEVDSEEKNIRVPIGEIHCPKIKGCEATYTQDTQNERDNFLEIKIFGNGGGDHKSISVGFGYKVTAKKQCLRFSQEMKLKFTKNKWRNGKEFTSVEVVEVTGHYFQEIIPKCSTCRKDYKEVKNSEKDYEGYRSYNIIANTAITEKIKIDTGTDFNLGIDFSELGIKNELKISTKVIKEITCEYGLVKGYDYLGYAPKSKSSLLCWTWNRQ